MRSNLQVKNRPPRLLGRTFLVDLARGAYREVDTEPTPPCTGMSFKVFYDPRHQVTLAVEGNAVWSFSFSCGQPGLLR